MEFFDPSKKKAHTIRLFTGYILAALVIIFVTTILLLQSYGYDINRRTGKIYQNGLVFVASKPISTDIYVNGLKKGSTDARLTIPSANYTFELKHDGYRTWKRTFFLEGGKIEQLVYPFLFPSHLVTADEQLYKVQPMLISNSPDRHWLIASSPGSLSTFDQFDITSANTPQVTLNLPKNVLSSPRGKHQLVPVEWSSDNRHLLIKHIYHGGTEFIMLDRSQPSKSFNVNKTLGLSPKVVALRAKKFDQLYLLSGSNNLLSRASVKNKQVTNLFKNVMTFKAFGSNTVLYSIATTKAPTKTELRIWDGRRDHLINSFASSDKIRLDIADFSGHNYVTAASLATGQVLIYRDVISQLGSSSTAKTFTSLRIRSPQFVSFSANARFAEVQNGNRFAVYDIENNRRFYYVIHASVSSGNQAKWMDGHRLSFVADGKTTVFDFDGTNQQILTAALAATNAYFNSGFDALYNLGPSVEAHDRLALTRTELRVK